MLLSFCTRNRTTMMKSILSIFWLLIILFSTSSCSDYSGETGSFFKRIFSKDTFRLYRMDISQGNVIDQKMIDKVQIGSRKEQVTYLLGEPILPSMFHEDRWDYVYYVDSLYGKDQYYKISLWFDKDRVIRIKRLKKDAKVGRSDKKPTK